MASFKKYSVSDVVLIHSIRPEILFDQIKSFVDNYQFFVYEGRKTNSLFKERLKHKKRKILFVIVADISSRRYLNVEKDINRYVKNIKLEEDIFVELWTVDRQKIFFSNIVEGFSKINKKINKKEILGLFSDLESEKLGGVRGIQNKSLIIADFLTGNSDNVIYHKLDDDIFAQTAFMEGNTLIIDHGFDIFNHKAQLLKSNNVRVIGSRYCVDSPSFIVDLSEYVHELKVFLEIVKKYGFSLSGIDWKKESKKFYTVPDKLIDTTERVETAKTPVIYSSDVISKVLKKIAKISSLVLLGNNRFVFNTFNNLDKVGYDFKDVLEGGFVSFLNSKKISPHMIYANQDLLFSSIEHSLHQGVKGDWPVSHLKVYKREPLLEGLVSSKGSKNDFVATRFILSLFQSDGHVLSKGLKGKFSILDWGLKYVLPSDIQPNLVECDNYLKKLKTKIKSKNLNSVVSIQEVVKKLLINWSHIEASYDFDNIVPEISTKAKKAYGLWKRHNLIWNDFRKFIKNYQNE